MEHIKQRTNNSEFKSRTVCHVKETRPATRCSLDEGEQRSVFIAYQPMTPPRPRSVHVLGGSAVLSGVSIDISAFYILRWMRENGDFKLTTLPLCYVSRAKGRHVVVQAA